MSERLRVIQRLVLVSVAVCVGCGQGGDSSSSTGTKSDLRCRKPAEEASIRITAEQLSSDFVYWKGAEVDATYYGKWIEVTGQVSRRAMRAETSDGGWIIGLAAKEGGPLLLHLPGRCGLERTRPLRVGDPLTALCRVAPSYDFDLTDCRPLDRGQ